MMYTLSYKEKPSAWMSRKLQASCCDPCKHMMAELAPREIHGLLRYENFSSPRDMQTAGGSISCLKDEKWPAWEEHFDLCLRSGSSDEPKLRGQAGTCVLRSLSSISTQLGAIVLGKVTSLTCSYSAEKIFVAWDVLQILPERPF